MLKFLFFPKVIVHESQADPPRISVAPKLMDDSL
jgi:hypothetical protein